MHFEIFPERTSVLATGREFYVRLVHDGRSLATTGDGYVSKASAQHAIDLIVSTGKETPVVGLPLLNDDHNYDYNGLRFEIYCTKGSGKTLLTMQLFEYRWRLCSRNGNKILHGNIAYLDEASCLGEIVLVKGATSYTRVEHVVGLNSLAGFAT